MYFIVKLWPGSHKHCCHGNAKKVPFLLLSYVGRGQQCTM